MKSKVFLVDIHILAHSPNNFTYTYNGWSSGNAVVSINIWLTSRLDRTGSHCWYFVWESQRVALHRAMASIALPSTFPSTTIL